MFLPEECGNFDCAILISMIEFNKQTSCIAL